MMAAEIREDLGADRPQVPLRSLSWLLSLPDPEWLADGWVPAEGLTVLWGAPGAGKSLAMLDLALGVATGEREWAGCELRPRTGRVVWVAAEGIVGLAARARAWMAARNVPADMKVPFAVVPWPLPITDSGTAEALAEAVLSRTADGVDLLVLDTWARCLGAGGGDENSAQDVGRAVANLDWLRRELRCAAVVIHHGNKSRDGSTPRGSGALVGAADAVHQVRQSEGGYLTVTCEKLRDGRPRASLNAAIQAGPMGPTLDWGDQAAPGEDWEGAF